MAINFIKPKSSTGDDQDPSGADSGFMANLKLGRWHWLFKDLVLLSCLALAAFLFMVLFSYSPKDPGFQMSDSVESFYNYGGATGAWLSSFLLYLFGVFGFVWPFGLLLASWVTLKIRTGAEMDYGRFVLSLVGLVLLVLSGAAMASLYMEPDSWVVALPYYSGGVLGYELSHFFLRSIDLLATTLLFLILFATGFSMLIGQSWLSISEATGRWAWQGAQFVQQKVTQQLNQSGGLKGLWQHTRQRAQNMRRSRTRLEPDAIPTVGKEQMTRVTRQSTGEKNLFGDTKAGGLVSQLTRKLSGKTETEAPSTVPESPEAVAQPVLAQEVNRPEPQVDTRAASEPMAEVTVAAPRAESSVASPPVEAQPQPVPPTEADAQAAATNQAPSVSPVPQPSVSQPSVTQSPEPVEEVAADSAPDYSSYVLPTLDLLDPAPVYDEVYSEDELVALSQLLETRLQEFGISVTVEEVLPGPVVTSFEIMPAPGVKVSQISNLSKDLARALAVQAVRVVDVVPGKPYVGIEIPNMKRQVVGFKDVLSADNFKQSDSPLTMGLGKDIAGSPVVANLAKMPHLLVAGTTGSGKSVGVNSMILSMLFKSRPDEVRLIMVDPKMLELSIYEDIPHLLTPVVTDMSDAANALRWCVNEMDKRYMLMSKLGVRNIAGFNEKVQAAIDAGTPIQDPLYQQAATFNMEMSGPPPTLAPLPYIVVVIDEFADMIMVVGKKVEELIARLAQKARASGIHLILATQRPSVNVITGLIKANIPTRMSFQVSSKVDSRTILDQMGAEQLLGMGDMLYLPPGTAAPMRVHGAFVSDDEVHRVVDFIKQQGAPQYLEAITRDPEAAAASSGGNGNDDPEQDAIYDEAVEFVIQGGRVSISSVQRRFKIGYNRAARIVEAMERAGIVSTMQANGNREVLVPKPEA